MKIELGRQNHLGILSICRLDRKGPGSDASGKHSVQV